MTPNQAMLERAAKQPIVKSFYSFNRILSYNSVYNFICGARGLGKTFGAKERAIAKAIRTGEQFIVLRRHKKEVGPSRDSFFADINKEGLFPHHEFRIMGNTALASPRLGEVVGETAADRLKREKRRLWRVIAYFVALSTAQNQKSVSYALVTTIIFDEFIIEKGHMQYLPNETVAFNNFYSTVDRYQDRVRVFFLANAITINNPYFIKYKIRPTERDEFIIRDDGFICAHFPDSEAFKAEVMQTRFGKFISGSEYAEYAVGNIFKDNNDNLIKPKDMDDLYIFTLETIEGTFAVWTGGGQNFYVQEKRPKGEEKIFTMLFANVKPGVRLMELRDRPLMIMRAAYRENKVWFDSQPTRNAFINIFDS